MWPFPGSAGFGRAPGENHALPGGSLVRKRPLPSQKNKWKQLWSPVLSATSASHSALTGLPPQCLHTENHMGQGKQTSFFFSQKTSLFVFLQASLPLNQLSYRKKMFFISPWKYKERLYNKTKGRAWMAVPQLVLHAHPFSVGQKILSAFPGRTHKQWCFTLKSFQPLRYGNVTQMRLNPEEKGRYRTGCRLESPLFHSWAEQLCFLHSE